VAQQLSKYGLPRLNAILTPEQVKALIDLDMLSKALGKGQMVAKGSQTAFIMRVMGEIYGIFANPLLAIKAAIGDYAFSRFISSDIGQKFLTEGIPLTGVAGRRLQEVSGLKKIRAITPTSRLETYSEQVPEESKKKLDEMGNPISAVLGAKTASADTGMPTNPNDMSTERIKAEIAFRESGVQKEPYTAINENENGTTDYGKYQVNEKTLSHWSKRFIGREITPQEFLRSPKLQELFIDKAIKHLGTLGAKSLDAFLLLWHFGWGDISSARVRKLKSSIAGQEYLNNRRDA